MERGDRVSICFTCGRPVQISSRWNRLPNGETCPTCRERILDLIQPALPRQGSDLPLDLVDEGFTQGDPPDDPMRA